MSSEPKLDLEDETVQFMLSQIKPTVRDRLLADIGETMPEDEGGVSPGGRAEGLRPADKREAASASGIAGETGRGNPATPPETTEQDLLSDGEDALPF